jgi:ABC-type nitrate/sulfonate/bicarbonate transport system substrate-binding protein
MVQGVLRPRVLLRARGCLLTLVVASIPIANGCRGAGRSTEHLSIGVSLLRISLPVFVAEQEGIFRTHGLDVDLRSYQTAQPMMDDVVAGRLDAGGFVAYPIAFLATEHAARPPRLATSLVEDSAHRISYALKIPTSRLRFPDDARGRVVGVLPTAAYQRWLNAILRAAGVDPSTVDVIPLAPPLQGQALASRAVDFLFTNDPVATTLLERGSARLADTGPPCPRYLGEPFAFGTFAMSASLADGRPREAARLVAAIDDAIDVIERDPSAGPQAMSTFLRPEERPTAWRYPPARFLSSSAVAADFVADEGRREFDLGIVRDLPPRMSWTPLR